MKVAIIGAGFTGLSAAIELLNNGYQVTVFEAEKFAGGLARGFGKNSWEWQLDQSYRHIFISDKEIINLAKTLGQKIEFFIPKTDSLINGKIKQLDSPISVLKFDQLTLMSRLRMGAGLAFLKLIPNGQFLEKYLVDRTLPKIIGQEAYEVIWEKLLIAKFGRFLSGVNLAWFWARVAKRSQKLGYFEGGFQSLADKAVIYIEKHGGEVRLKEGVDKIKFKKQGFEIKNEDFDQILITVPLPLINNLFEKEVIEVPRFDYLWAQTLVLELKESLMPSYWLNILEKNWPFLVVVEHTRLIDKKHYADSCLVYLGNYLAGDDERLGLSKEKLLALFLPYIKKINPKFNKGWIKESWKFQSPFSQPVFPQNYSEVMPKIKTKIPGLFLANMEMVYPWDRGTNYAVLLGQMAARKMVGV